MYGFKNSETEKEIFKILREFEGVKQGQENEYLKLNNLTDKAILLEELKIIMKKFWFANQHISFTDLKGLISVAIDDIQFTLMKNIEKRKDN